MTFAIINPKPEVNEHSVMPASSLRVYESSFSTATAPVVTLTMVEPDGTLAAGVRLDRTQMAVLIDTLLEITSDTTLDKIRDWEHGEGYESGYKDGLDDGDEAGYDRGFEKGLSAIYSEFSEDSVA